VTELVYDAAHAPSDTPNATTPAGTDAVTQRRQRARPVWYRYVVSWVIWTIAGIVLLEQGGFVAWDAESRGRLGNMLAGMWLWALLTPPIMDLGRRWPLEQGTWARNLPKHLLAAFGFAVLDAVLLHPIRPYIGIPIGNTLLETFKRGLFACEASYIVIVAVAMSGRYAEMYQERKAAATALASELTTARLAALNAQLRPHFLFNTLNAIAELLHTDPKRADRLLLSLAVLLRRSFAAGERQEVSLAEELRFVEEYLAILGARLDDRLHVTIDVSAEVRDAMVPSFLLQPLVENAIRHGIERVPGGGTLAVIGRRDDTRLRLEVRDDGAGLNAPRRASDGSGLGVRTTRERLKHLYGDGQTFELVPLTPRGTTAIVTLPLRHAPEEADSTERAPFERAEEVA
jgi:signal transduction histidine kinase